MSVSAMPFALLLTTAAATAVGAAALHAAHGLRKQVTALRTELAEGRSLHASVPEQQNRSTGTPAEEIRTAVAEALAEERERELAEARAFWAAQEARDAADAPSLLGGFGEDVPFFMPRQSDFAGLEAMDLEAGDALDELTELAELTDLPEVTEYAEYPEDSPELAAARRRHPSHPDFVPVQTPVVTDHERTVNRLERLADTGTELTDVRPGPLGTLDVYVFADGTTLCMTPGHRETAERLADSLRSGEQPVLLGGSGVSGAYALTFSCGKENVYILADRVIASF
uniref:Secreted protein n=1 Tax=Streptomyces sp. NBC_01401 TaxID=2903854 RepID=A0AAU3H4X8_9ACTN